MSESTNPYQSPETVAVPVKPLVSQGELTETMLVFLKGASPWLRFLGILGFISAGLIALWGILFFALGTIMGRVWTSVPGFESFTDLNNTLGAAFGFLMGLAIIGIALLIFFPSLFTYRFGAKIRSYLRNGLDQDLEQAFKNNKSLWKYYGIICIIYLAFVPVALISSVIIAIVSAFS